MVFTIERRPTDLPVRAACGSGEVWRQGVIVRRFRTLPAREQTGRVGGQNPSAWHAKTAEPVAPSGRSGLPNRDGPTPRSFARYALELSRHMTIKDVACHLGVSWDVVKEIQKKDLQKRFAKPKLKHVKQIAIDEISTGKGHNT